MRCIQAATSHKIDICLYPRCSLFRSHCKLLCLYKKCSEWDRADKLGRPERILPHTRIDFHRETSDSLRHTGCMCLCLRSRGSQAATSHKIDIYLYPRCSLFRSHCKLLCLYKKCSEWDRADKQSCYREHISQHKKNMYLLF